MNHQLAISYPADYVGKQAWERQRDALRAAMKHLGAKEVAFKLDTGHTHVSDALNGVERKVWHPHWTHIVKAMLASLHDDMTAREILRAICESEVDYTPFALRDDDYVSPEDEATWARVEAAKKRKARAR